MTTKRLVPRPVSFSPLAAFLIALPLAACDGSVTPGAPSDKAAGDLSKSICTAAYRCCTMSELMPNDGAGTDEASCEVETRKGMQGTISAIKDSEQKGRAEYDGAKVEACVAYLDGASCSDLHMTGHLSGVAACSSFANPKVAVGGVCAHDWECVGGFCFHASQDAPEGVCRARGASGATCDADHLCDSSLACNGATMMCAAAPAPTPPTNACFYTSGCNATGADRGAGTLFALALLGAVLIRQRRAARNR